MRLRPLLTIVCALLISTQAFANIIGQLFETEGREVSETAFKELGERMGTFGFDAALRKDIIESLRVSRENLARAGKIDGEKTLASLIRKNKEIPEAAHEELVGLLKQDIKTLDRDKLARIVTLMAGDNCSECITDAAKVAGFTKFARPMTDELESFRALYPSSPQGLQAAIINKAKAPELAALGLKDIQPAMLMSLTTENKVNLLHFLTISTSDSALPGEKKLAQELKIFFSKGEPGSLFKDNKLYEMVSPVSGFTDADKEKLAAEFAAVNAEMPDALPRERMKAFDERLAKKAGSNKDLQAKFTEMSNRRSVYNGKSCAGCWCTF